MTVKIILRALASANLHKNSGPFASSPKGLSIIESCWNVVWVKIQWNLTSFLLVSLSSQASGTTENFQCVQINQMLIPLSWFWRFPKRYGQIFLLPFPQLYNRNSSICNFKKNSCWWCEFHLNWLSLSQEKNPRGWMLFFSHVWELASHLFGSFTQSSKLRQDRPIDST